MRWARFAAPLALVAVIGGTYYVIEHGLRHKSAGHPAHRATTGPAGATGANGSARVLPTTAKPAVYVVKPGDTLSEIAAREHVSLSTLEGLNPAVNPNALQAGQRLKLPR